MKEGWTQKMITEVAWFQEGPGVRNTQYTDSGVKLLNVANLVDGKVDLSTSKRYISENEAYGKYRHFLVDDGDFIVASSGIQVEYIDKKMGFINKSHLPLCMNTSTIRFKPIDSKVLNMRFFMYYLKSQDFKNQLARLITGIAQLNYGPSHLKRMYIPMTGITEQQRIVAELDLLTGIIDKQKAQLKELDTLAQSIFYDMFGDPVENEKGWKKGCVSELCCPKKEILRASKSFSSSDVIEYIDISSIDNKKNIMTSTSSVVFSDAPSRAQQVVIKDDILVSLVRPNLKNVAVVNRDDNNLVASSGFCVLRHLPSISYEFLFYITKSEAFTEYLMQRVSGANYPAVREEDIKDYPTIVPPIELQELFAQKIQSIESQKASINQSIAETQELFDYTMDKYFG